MDYSKFISTASAKRKPSGISEMRAHLDKSSPSLVWLASGMPNPEKFPFREVSITLQDGKVLSLTQDCLSSGLQYGNTQGYIPLVKQLKAMTKLFHSPPQWDKCDLLVTVGCQAGLSMALEMLLNPGDFVVLPSPCYSDVLCMLSGMDVQYLAIEGDDHGMNPDLLRAALTQAVEGGSKGVPKALYLVPNSSNPTGTTMDVTRRQHLYDLAHHFDLIILEDDPYFFLQYDEYEQPPPSFLSMDTDGRVLRFDSFSKIVSSGLRVGYVTGPAPLVERMNVHMQARVVCGPMLSQVMMSELLREWGDDGFKRHVADLRTFYSHKRNALIKAAEMHLAGLCEWTIPKGGIFLWLKVPELRDTGPMLIKRAIKRDIALVPGKDFVVDSGKPCQYMRAAFSCVTADQMMKGMENLGKLIREEIILQNAQTKETDIHKYSG